LLMIFPARFLALDLCRTLMEGRWQPKDPVCNPDNMFQFALAVGRRTPQPKPDSDGGGEDGLND
jgi:hypothetical protein